MRPVRPSAKHTNPVRVGSVLQIFDLVSELHLQLGLAATHAPSLKRCLRGGVQQLGGLAWLKAPLVVARCLIAECVSRRWLLLLLLLAPASDWDRLRLRLRLRSILMPNA